MSGGFVLTKAQASSSIKKINTALASLSPTAIITLFEIDISQLALDQGVTLKDSEKIFRFHNNIKLFGTSIIWQCNEYIAAPIKADGFEMNARGTLPTPKLAISVSPEGITALAILKQQLNRLDDLIGAKVTRIRTYAEHLDEDNFFGLNVDYNIPDVYAELPRDVFYIDRKSAENKSIIEFELASILDVEGVKLPNRLVLAQRCTATYRCEGCLYEYRARFGERNSPINVLGDATAANLPPQAPPVANEKDELITQIIGTTLTDRGLYESRSLSTYRKGHSVYITKNGVPYYFVASTDTVSDSPPNEDFWIADKCSKLINGCRLRYGINGVTLPGMNHGTLPFVGYPSANRIR